MNYIFYYIIILLLIYISYDYLFCNIESFSNDAFQYLEQIHYKITNNNFDNLNIKNNLSISNKLNLKKGFNSDVTINNNLVNENIIKAKNGYINNVIINNKWPIYTKKDALAIGRLNNNNIIPALYMNPGSEENLWVFENISDNKFWYYAWNSRVPEFGHYSSDNFNMDNILINNGKSTFIPYDKL